LDSPYAFKSVPAITVSVLILPLFDTLRVFSMRILKRKSPFYPDRTHIHHLLIDAGLNHLQGTGVLISINIFFIALAVLLQDIGSFSLLMLILGLAAFITLILFQLANRKKLNAA
jgi:UDP-N-acetylmuramyl pentapeptide phosphotransferase/UDP-N-acetylglucosamine-1-phosphate transferase